MDGIRVPSFSIVEKEVSPIGIKGMRKPLGYNDRNDGFMRSWFSKSKNHHSQNTKEGKVVRTKMPHKVFCEEDLIEVDFE